MSEESRKFGEYAQLRDSAASATVVLAAELLVKRMLQRIKLEQATTGRQVWPRDFSLRLKPNGELHCSLDLNDAPGDDIFWDENRESVHFADVLVNATKGMEQK